MESLDGSDYDIALLQEIELPIDGWERAHYTRGADVVRLSDRAEVARLTPIPQGPAPKEGRFAVSVAGTIAVAHVIPPGGVSFIAVSIYARWERTHPATRSRWIYADAMAHRAISDLSVFIGHRDPARHRILVAGDFNLIHGALESNPLALPARDRSVFSRLEALGLVLVGPQQPDGRAADPVPPGLPGDTRNVPTYYTTRQRPESAANQLDYVFASRGFHERVKVRALNNPAEWGPSDHCRVAMEVDVWGNGAGRSGA